MVIAALAIQHRTTAMSNPDARPPHQGEVPPATPLPVKLLEGSHWQRWRSYHDAGAPRAPYNSDDRLRAYLFRPATPTVRA